MTLVNATTGEVLADLTPADARTLTDTIRSAAETVWSLLHESYARKAWTALGYDSWRVYATTEFGMSQGHAYRLLNQARVIHAIETAAGSPFGEITEAEARDLGPVLDDAVVAVEEAVGDAPDPADVDDVEARVRAALDGVRTAAVAKQIAERQIESGGASTREGEEVGADEAALVNAAGDSGAGSATPPDPAPKDPPLPVDPTLGYRAAFTKARSATHDGLFTFDPERCVETSDDHKGIADFAASLHDFAGQLEKALAGPRLKAVN